MGFDNWFVFTPQVLYFPRIFMICRSLQFSTIQPRRKNSPRYIHWPSFGESIADATLWLFLKLYKWRGFPLEFDRQRSIVRSYRVRLSNHGYNQTFGCSCRTFSFFRFGFCSSMLEKYDLQWASGSRLPGPLGCKYLCTFKPPGISEIRLVRNNRGCSIQLLGVDWTLWKWFEIYSRLW